MNQVVKSALTLTTLALSLAACSQPSATPSAETVRLTLSAPFAARGAVTPQGLPSGATPVTFIKVKVYDARGQQVHFDGANVYQPGGQQDALTLDAAHPTTTALLPQGTYRFESVGRAHREGEFLAYGDQPGQALNSATPNVKLALHTLAHADVADLNVQSAFLSTALPTSFVATGDQIEVRAQVPAAGVSNLVPLGDYTSNITVNSDAGTVLSQSKLGAKVRVTGTVDTSELVVQNTLGVWVATGAETAEVRSFTKTLRLPVARTGLSVDLLPPRVADVAVYTDQWSSSKMVVGTASDDMAIAGVQVYDGTTLIGSTDETEAVNGAGHIRFGQTGTNAFTLYGLPLDIVGHDLTIIATDSSGNQARVQHTAENDPTPTLRFPYKGWESNQAFPVTAGAQQWFRLDLRAGLLPAQLDIHNDWSNGWGDQACVFDATIHATVGGPSLSTYDTCQVQRWYSTGAMLDGSTGGLYYLNVTGRQNGRGNIDFFRD